MSFEDRYVPWKDERAVWVCRDCGCLVTAPSQHDEWHRRQEPEPKPRRF